MGGVVLLRWAGIDNVVMQLGLHGWERSRRILRVKMAGRYIGLLTVELEFTNSGSQKAHVGSSTPVNSQIALLPALSILWYPMCSTQSPSLAAVGAYDRIRRSRSVRRC